MEPDGVYALLSKLFIVIFILLGGNIVLGVTMVVYSCLAPQTDTDSTEDTACMESTQVRQAGLRMLVPIVGPCWAAYWWRSRHGVVVT